MGDDKRDERDERCVMNVCCGCSILLLENKPPPSFSDFDGVEGGDSICLSAVRRVMMESKFFYAICIQ